MKPKQERHSHTLHDYSNRHNMMISDLKKRFWLSTILSVPVIALSPMIQEILGFNWVFNQSIYVLFIISSAIFFYGGWPFLAGLISELKSKAPGMMTLIAIAIIVAYTYSSAVVFGLVGKTFFWELVTLIDIMLLGHWIEMQSELGVSKTLELLVNIMPISAHKIVGDETQETNIDQLQKNDIILVAPGEKVPIDGIITQGESFLNESMLTGKSQPVKKK